MYTDARSTPPRIAAVLFKDGHVFFADMEPPAEVLDNFRFGGDNGIMSLELLSIALGISAFGNMVAGRNVIIYSDNTGAEAATRKGTTKNFDQHSLVHCMWKRFAELHVGVWVVRVPTKDNIADCPSREQYELLGKIGAVEVPAFLDPVFASPQSWKSLSIGNTFRNM